MAEDGKRTSIFICKAMAFFIVGTYTLRSIFAAVYFKQIGLSSTHAGIVQGASPLSNAIGGIIFGYIADRRDARKEIFILAYLSYAVTPFLITLPHASNHCPIATALSKNNSSSKPDQSISGHSDPHFTNDNNELLNFSLNYAADDFSGQKQHTMKQTLTEYLLQRKVERNPSRQLKNELTHRLNQGNPIIQSNNLALPNKFADTQYKLSLLDSNSNVSKWSKNNTKKDILENQRTNDSDVQRLFIIVLVVTIIGDFLGGAAINLMDAVCVAAVEDKKQYGRLRVWGNIGQAVTIPLIALITYFKKVGICGVFVGDYKFALYSSSLISSIGWFIAIFKVHFPSSKIVEKDKDDKAKGTLKELITPLETWSLLVNAFFDGAFHGVLATFLFWTMVVIEPSNANVSIAVANFARNGAALFAYFLVPKMLHAVGYRNILTISFLVLGAAFSLTAFMRSTWLSIAVEILSGSAYALSMSACISYIGEVAHPSLAVTAQGLLHFMYTGVGNAAGPALAGVIMDYTGQTITFLTFAGMTILAMIYSITVQWILKIRQSDYQEISKDEEKEVKTSQDQSCIDDEGRVINEAK